MTMNTVKITTVAAAVAAALGSSGSLALTTGAAYDFSIIQMGSSAFQAPIQQAWTDFCAAGTLTIYEDNLAATPGGSYRIYSCTLGTNAAIPAAIQSKNMAYYERLSGGSVYGVNPVALSLAESYMTLADCASVSAASGTVTCVGAGLPTGSAAPEIGISDVEPAMFTGANLPAAFTALTPAQLALLTVDHALQQTFAVGVGNGVSGLVTNLSSAQISTLLTGTTTDWHTINQAIAPKTKVTVCVRTNGSGTQAGANALWLNSPCSPSAEKALGAHAILNSSTSVLLTCLDNNPNSVGIFGLADGPNAGDTFSVVNIDNVAATAQNAAEGLYRYQVESTINYRAIASYTADQQALITALKNIFGNPTELHTVNAGFPAPALNANYNNGAAGTPSAPYNAALPTAWGSRGGNTCAPYLLFFPL